MPFSRSAVLFCLVHVSLGAALEAQVSASGLAPGRWPVGFTRLTCADSTRPPGSGQTRLLDVGVWYPARETSLARVTYREYLLSAPPHQASSPGPDARHQEFDEFVALLKSRGALDAVIQKWMSAPMLAAVDAPLSGGRFPLVLVAQGNAQTMQDQAPLAEYLASYG